MTPLSVYFLTLEDIQEICFSLIKELMQLEEPVPEFETRFPEKLESILELPKQTYASEELYKTIFEKAACYFYFITKNHPLLNGNKRLAIVATYVFLRINGHQMIVPLTQMYDFAIKLATTTGEHKQEFEDVVNFIKTYTKPVLRD